MNLQDRYKQVRENIVAAAERARRSEKEITLVAVSKNAEPAEIRSLLELGQRHFGESKVQQLQQHAAQIQEWLDRRRLRAPDKGRETEGIIWHMIGHLQRNKVKPALQWCRYIHGVDSLRLAEEIQTAAAKLERPVHIFLEVNAGGEATKYGVSVGAAQHLAEQIDTMEGVQLVGLMGMAPYSKNPEDARGCFARLREIFEEIRFRKIGGLHFKHLSMGMSGDYQVAIEEGATMVRIGTALFGEARTGLND